MATRRIKEKTSSKMPNEGQKVLASVYIGAAFLILIVGIKTLIQTKPDSWDDMIITVFFVLSISAIVGEFILLIRYALHMRKQKSDDEKVTGTSIGFDPALASKIDELITSNSSVVNAMTGFEIHQKSSTDMLQTHTEAIIKISEGLDTLVNDEVDRKVQDAITKLISSKIN